MMKRTAKRSLTLLLSLAMVFSLLIGFQLPALAEGETVISILHTNDVHGRLYMVDSNNAGMMGIDKVAAIKNDTPNSILVDVGDAFHGLAIATINKGLNAVDLMVAAGYQVMTPGNHDFNYGSDRLLELAEIAADGGLEIISSNVVEKDSGDPFLPTTTIVEVDGIKVGFFGLSTLNTPEVTKPTNVETLEFAAYKESAESAIAELREAGADIIVGLAHIEHDAIIELIKALDDKPDVVIEGHDHRKGDETVEGVLIAGAGQYQENLGVVTLTIDADGAITAEASLITKEEADELDGDEDVKAMAEEMKAAVIAEFSQVVAKSEILLSSARGTNDGVLGVRNSEQPLGNLVADALRTIGETDIALVNGGGLRADIKVGDLKKEDIFSVLPFGNWLVIKEVTPKILYELMENGVSRLPNADGRFPQISGMTVLYDAAAEADARIVSIKIGDELLDKDDDETIYTLASNDFLVVGGDGYTALEGTKTVTELGTLDEIFIQYIVDVLDGVITAADAKIEGRISAIPSGWAAEDVIAAIEAGLVPDSILFGGWQRPATRVAAVEAVAILVEKFLGASIDEIAEEEGWDLDEKVFEDTDSKEVAFFYFAGIVEGIGDDLFDPNGPYKRAHVVTLLGRTLEVFAGFDVEGENPFTDVPDYAAPYVGFAAELGIIEGIGGGLFDPDTAMTNEQVAVLSLHVFAALSALVATT